MYHASANASLMVENLDRTKIQITISVAVIVKISKNKNLCKKGISYLDSAARNCENGGKYLAIVIDDSVIM